SAGAIPLFYAGRRKMFRRIETNTGPPALSISRETRVDMEAIGRRRWAIPEGYIPSESSYSNRELVSHETACILNAADHDAHVTITFFSAAREPVGPYHRCRVAHFASALQ